MELRHLALDEELVEEELVSVIVPECIDLVDIVAQEVSQIIAKCGAAELFLCLFGHKDIFNLDGKQTIKVQVFVL